MKKNKFLGKDFLIKGIEAKNYNDDITGEELIEIKGNCKKEIKIKSKYINWYLTNLQIFIESDNFMLCVTYPENCKINYIMMDNKIGDGYNNLFNKVIKSKPIKQAMMFDDEARKYQYLFSNDEILNEIKENTHFVCFPFNNYFGYSDKKSLDIYIKSNYNFMNLSMTLAIFDNIIRSQYHEYKHISRVYYNMIDDAFGLKTPKFSLKQFTSDRKYINNFYDESLKIIKEKTSNFTENSKCFSKSLDEYGDLVEYAIYGFKVENQNLRSVLFCLNDDSWDLDPENFNKNLKFNMRLKTNGFLLIDFLKGFGRIIYDYFDFFKEEEDYSLNTHIPINRSASNSPYPMNDVIEIRRISHHMHRQENNLLK